MTSKEKYVLKLKENVIFIIAIIISIYVVVYDFIHGSLSNHDFLEGIWIEFHGFIIEVFLILFGLNWWSTRQDKKKLKPAMKLIIYRVDRIDGWLTLGLNNFCNPTEKSYGLITHGLKQVELNFNKLNSLIDLNASRMSTDDLSELIEIMELIEELRDKLEFISLMYTDKETKFDYIVLSPITELKLLQEKLSKLVSLYGYTFAKDRNNLPSIEVIQASWDKFISNQSLFDKPEDYKKSKNKLIFTFDTDTWAKMGGIEVGDSIKVFKTF